jgi:protein-tyrosine-phosphatase
MPPPGGSSRWSACCTSGGDLKDYPQSVLFSCDHNAVRSPMAEGIMKKFVGTRTYVQSVGVVNDLEIDGFAIAVCKEIGVALERHRSRSFEEMEQMGEMLSGFDMIVTMSPASQRKALELTRYYHLTVDYWPVMDPTGIGESREQKLNAYRQTRDQIVKRVQELWGV